MSQVECGHPGNSSTVTLQVQIEAQMTDDWQQRPEHTEARLRADSSSVAVCNDADLEQTAQSPGTMLQISS